ncbi:MAG: NADAR family protein [Pseudomonadaceae bacterium]|nr:NADAR family protein [Pseudomonadaceae bacterium]
MKAPQQTALIRCRDSEGAVPLIMSFRGDYRFLSNFYRAHVFLPAESVLLQGRKKHLNLPHMTFNSVENAYMAWKSPDVAVRQQIKDMSPHAAKELSQTEEFVAAHRADYSDEARITTMLMLVRQKFLSPENAALADMFLQRAASATLIEGTTWNERFFGFCIKTGVGQNYLGRILMTVRDELRVREGMCPLLEKPVLPKAVLER